MARKRGRPPDEVVGLTDAELLGRLRRISDGHPRPDDAKHMVEAVFLPRSAEAEARVIRRLCGEIARRSGAMLRAARLARELEIHEVAAAISPRVHPNQIAEIEGGSRWWGVSRDFFERACTEGGLDPDDPALRGSAWFPLLDHPYCRTIRAVAVEPAWLDSNGGTAIDLARSITRDRSFHLLPILGDALEDAGCGDPAILGHCRAPGVHVLRCWVTDALIGAGR